MPAETGKQRASRIPLDYYKHWTRLDKWFLWSGLLALALAVAWPVSAYFLRSDNGDMLYSRGHVTAKHGAWDSNCSTCHDSFSQMNERVAFAGHNVTNAKCIACHEGPKHAQTQLVDQSCASCHRDHGGKEASLVRVADSDCTSCHGNLTAHTKGDKTKFEPKITHFADGPHPKFSSVKEDPGKLKFNHKLHMTAGIVRIPDDKKPLTFAKLDEADRKRYMEQLHVTDPQAKVQLNCASCHVLDSGDYRFNVQNIDVVPTALLLPPRSAGAYLLPITYENQCRACHPTTFDRKEKDDPRSGKPILHGWQPDDVRDWLEGYYSSQWIKGNKAIFETIPGQVPPMPGKEPVKVEKKTLADRVDTALAGVFRSERSCAQCHSYVEGNNPKVPDKVVPTNVNTVWLKHAKFNHASHRAVDCKACHEGGYTSEKATDVLVPNIDNCVQCHAPPSKKDGNLWGGARFDCAECHRYHNGDHPLQGIGALERTAKPPQMDVKSFLSGKHGK